MSALYGTLVGNRSIITRCGSRKSGLKVSAQSWSGSLITRMDLDENDNPIIRLDITKDSSSGSWGGDTVFTGSLEELKEALTDYKNKKSKK